MSESHTFFLFGEWIGKKLGRYIYIYNPCDPPSTAIKAGNDQQKSNKYWFHQRAKCHGKIYKDIYSYCGEKGIILLYFTIDILLHVFNGSELLNWYLWKWKIMIEIIDTHKKKGINKILDKESIVPQTTK